MSNTPTENITSGVTITVRCAFDERHENCVDNTMRSASARRLESRVDERLRIALMKRLRTALMNPLWRAL